jgi:hypothetical protein
MTERRKIMRIIASSQASKTTVRWRQIETSYFRARMLFVLALVLFMAGVVQAQAPERFTMTSNDLPFYARIERGLILTDGEWAAIAYYRPPECIRSDFNLLDFFDAPAAFGCNAAEPYLDGFGIFMNGPFEGPIQSRLQTVPGRIMPVWFVKWSELEAAIADDELYIGELAALPSLLRGGATFYSETLHPLQVAQQPKITIVAFGYLEDGREFVYEASGTRTLRHVRIVFD